MREELIKQLETPCVVIDLGLAEKNIVAMQAAADEAGCLLRPHIKTHKMPLFARMQVEHGAAGITCAKVSEAEVMADGGLNDIFLAYPQVGEMRLRRVTALAGRVKRLIVGVDSLDGARMLNEAAEKAGLRIEVRLEIDTGAGRTGAPQEAAVRLAVAISEMEHLKLTGIYTFKSLVLGGKPTADNEAAGIEEGAVMEQVAEAIRAAGVALPEISAGSTPTGIQAARTGKVTEIRPGTYIFKDYMLVMENAAQMEEIAVRIYATVVSTPSEEYAVIDGGTKTFPMDILLDAEPYYYPGYAIVEGNPDLQLRRMNEEHGMLVSRSGKTGLKVGDVICLIPIHVCTAINMQNQVYLYDGDTVRKETVAGRGMLV